MLADALLSLPRHPLSGVVSPPLLATTGIVPLSIFSTGPDIIGHYYDCIISARQEVIIMTNYWQGGQNVNKITGGLRELNRREAQRQKMGQSCATQVRDPRAPQEPPRARIVVKVMWDRGPRNIADVIRMRTDVPPSEWEENGLPTPEEVPCLHMEVLNYHRAIMGTFHAKLLLVDRRVALVNSNNIQDRPNLEAMARLEGDIVNSVYEHALFSWGLTMDPPLPCLELPATADPGTLSFAPVARRKSFQPKPKKVGPSLALPQQPESQTVEQPDDQVQRTGPAASEEDLARLSRMTIMTLRERAQNARARLQQDADEAEEEELHGNHRLADVIDSVRRHRSSFGADHASSHPGSSPPDDTPHSRRYPETNETNPVEEDTTAWDAARKAGNQWKQKVLGDRFNARPGNTGTAPNDIPLHELHTNGPANNSAPTSPTADGSGSRKFADVVEALMQKEGIHPPGWADGALDALGLGESSSKNVAWEARRARAARQAGHAQQLHVPVTVEEEDQLSRTYTGPSSASYHHSKDRPQTPRSVSSTFVSTQGNKGNKDLASSHADVERPVHLALTPSRQSMQSIARAVPGMAPMDDGLHPSPDGAPGTDALHMAALSQAVDVVPPLPPAPPTHTSPTHPPGGKTSASVSAPTVGKAAGESEAEDGPPGLHGYYRAHRLSNTSRQSAAERLNKITDRLDFANNSKVKGEITPERLQRMNTHYTHAALAISSPAVIPGGASGTAAASTAAQGASETSSSNPTTSAASGTEHGDRTTTATSSGPSSGGVPPSSEEGVAGAGKVSPAAGASETAHSHSNLNSSLNSNPQPQGQGQGQGQGQAQPQSQLQSHLQTQSHSRELSDPSASSEDGTEDEIVYDPTDFSPYIFHRPHRPVPMALVNRRPHGTPGHSDIKNPQASAWLAGFRYAQKEVFIQSPTLNAAPIKAAILAAVRRGVKVVLWLDLGFNDKSESMPFQGGTNEQVVVGMYRELKKSDPEARKNLQVYWYTGKDMTRPLNAVRKQRNCHVKFAAFDGQVAILGSGNQDTQSWFHSQEVNVMVDDRLVVKEWIDALRRNQSTHIYGLVDDDGIWRGRTGKQKVDTGKEEG